MNGLVLVFALLSVSSTLAFAPQPRNLEDFLSVIGLSNLPFPDPVTPSSLGNSSGTTTYAYTPWSNYSTCDKVCGGGMMERTRRCLANGEHEVFTTRCSSATGNRPSPLDLVRRYWKGSGYTVEIQRKPCNTRVCATTEWGDWGPCDHVCGDGTQYTSRSCLESKDQTQCNFQRTKSRSCNNQNCFRMTGWTEWGTCSRDCGGGIMKRSRRCVPALNSTQSEYTILSHMLALIHPGRNPNIYARSFHADPAIVFHYLSQYLSDCSESMFDSDNCNTFACPTCPFNQIHYSCKPCQHHCKDVPRTSIYNNILNFNPFPSSLHLSGYLHSHVTGCHGVCESGCGCPLVRPLLGADQRCYRLPVLCPDPRVISSIGSNGIPGFGRTFVSTYVPPTETGSTTTAETTTVDLIDEEQGPLEEENENEQVDPRLVEIPVEGDNRPYCEYGRLIATKPGVSLACKCKGTLKTLSCYTTEDTSCPMVCKKTPVPRVCPPVESAIAISALTSSECADQCTSDTECSVGDMCCNTSCGMKCVGSVAGPEEEE